MTKQSKSKKMGQQYRRASDLPGMGGFNYPKLEMQDILDKDVIIHAGKIIKGRLGEFAIFDIGDNPDELNTVTCGGENVIRLIQQWLKTDNPEPIIACFSVVKTDSGMEVYTVS